MADMSPITLALFWSKVAIPANHADCWLWTGTQNDTGYGRFRIASRWAAAHRYAYKALKGPIPDGMQVRHLCHNRLCCNPMHLEIGTAKENIQDSVVAGRHPHGGTNGNAKLGNEAVIYIRQNPDRLTGNQLAEQFGVSKGTISNVKSGKIWRHV